MHKILVKRLMRLYPDYQRDTFALGSILGAMNDACRMLPHREPDLRSTMHRLVDRYAPLYEIGNPS